MKNPNPLMLLRIAQADACGMAVEYIKPEHEASLVAALRFEGYVGHPVLTDVKPGMYTDDTQMSVAIAEALLKKENPNVLDFGDAFLECYKRDPRGGYSARVKKMLEESATAEDLIRMDDAASDFNGAAMRAVPIGVVSDPSLVLWLAAKQSLLTHDTLGGKLSAQLVALMSHFALYTDLPFSDLRAWLMTFFCRDEIKDVCMPWDGRVAVGHNRPGMGLLTVIHTLLVESKSLMGMMERLMKWGGDTDSVAAIAWGIASCRFQDEKLPDFMERDLEVGSAYGVEFLKDLGTKLMVRYA